MIGSTTTPSGATQQAWEFEKPIHGGIVVGVDGSRESIAALNTAAAMARVRRCPLHAVSVLPPMSSYQFGTRSDVGTENLNDLRCQLRNSELAGLMKALEPASDWSAEVVIGRPPRELTRVADLRGADLIVLGRRQHGSMDRVLGSETPLQVMRMSAVPVLAVESEMDSVHTMVAAIDFSPSSVRAAELSLQLLKAAGSGTLYLVFVERPAELIVNEFRLSAETRFPGDVVIWFRRLVDSLGSHPGILVEPVVLNGHTVTSLAEFAERVGADLIAAGSHSHGRFERFLIGSVSTGLVRSASCPVMVVPPRS